MHAHRSPSRVPRSMHRPDELVHVNPQLRSTLRRRTGRAGIPSILLTGPGEVSLLRCVRGGSRTSSVCHAAGAEAGHANNSAKTPFRSTTSRLLCSAGVIYEPLVLYGLHSCATCLVGGLHPAWPTTRCNPSATRPLPTAHSCNTGQAQFRLQQHPRCGTPHSRCFPRRVHDGYGIPAVLPHQYRTRRGQRNTGTVCSNAPAVTSARAAKVNIQQPAAPAGTGSKLATLASKLDSALERSSHEADTLSRGARLRPQGAVAKAPCLSPPLPCVTTCLNPLPRARYPRQCPLP